MKEQQYILKNAKSFELKDIFDCGQCFRWNKESDESYGYDRRCDKKERQGKFLYGFLCCSSGGICGGKSKQEKGISGDTSVLL